MSASESEVGKINASAGLSGRSEGFITLCVSKWRSHRTESVHSIFGRLAGVSLALSAAILLGSCDDKKKSTQDQELTVQVAEVMQQDVPLEYSWVGTTDGFQNATIRAKVEGYLMSQNYQEGGFVKKGTTLFQIDPRPFQAALAQAQAQLATTKANADLARTTLTRQTELFQKQVISQQEFDAATQKARADLATEQAAQANVQAAQLNLDYCTIVAPLDGIVGKAEAQIGDLVGPSGTALTSMSQVEPMLVYFSISEQDYLESEQLIREVSLRPLEDRIAVLTLTLSDGSVYPHKGKFDFANRQVDSMTGSILMAGLFPNPDLLLRPGQFAKVSAITRIADNALLVPQRAVIDQQGTSQVAVVGDDNKVQIRAVTVGRSIGSDYIITDGLKAGEKVVAEGIQKVKNGMTVKSEPFKDTSARPVPTVPPYLAPYANQMAATPEEEGANALEAKGTSPSGSPTATPASSPSPTPQSTPSPATTPSPTPSPVATTTPAAALLTPEDSPTA